MRSILALLAFSLTLPATAAVSKSKTKKPAAPATKATYGDLEGPTTPANRASAAGKSRGGVSQSKLAAPTVAGARRPVEIAPVVGLTVNSISGLEDWIKDQKIKNYSTTPDTGFTVGGVADLGLGLASTVIQTGLVYTQINQKFSVEKEDHSFILNYLSVPIQGKTYVLGGRSGLFVNYGFAANFILDAKHKADGQDDQNLKDKLNSVNFVAATGVGYTMPIGSAKGVAGVSFNRSLNKINSEGDNSLYNNTFIFNLGVLL